MKKSCIIGLLFGLLLILPFVIAEEQINKEVGEENKNSIQTYSNFNRFVDNVKLFLLFGNNKVSLALEIREKEVNSALNNIKENKEEEANENLQNALNKLLIVQEKVSVKAADKVAESVNRILEKIEESNLTESLDRYVLEEKKTQLITDLVVEVDGKEGQTLTREIVKNETTGEKQISIETNGKEGQTLTRVIEIQKGINQIDSNISDWVVEHTYAEGTSAGGEAGVVIEGDNAGGKNNVQIYVAQGENNKDNGLTTEVKTYVAGDGTLKNDPLPEPNLNQFNPDLYDPDARAPGDTIDETYDDNIPTYAEGTTAEGDPGTPGTNEIGPAVDSNEGD